MNRKNVIKFMHLLSLLALMGSGSACLAQQERNAIVPLHESIAIGGDGTPDRLDMVFAAPGDTPSVASVTVRAGRRVTTLPACIVALLPSRQVGQVKAYLAWQHDEPGLSRLGIEFAAPEPAPASGPGKDVIMMFDKRTAKLVDVYTRMHYANEIAVRHVSPRLAQRCTRQELDAVLDPMHKHEML